MGRGLIGESETLCDGDCYADEPIFDLAEGSYNVKVNQRGFDGKYCYREESIQVLRGSTNRNNLANQDELVLFPNPARNRLNLAMSDLEKPIEIKIYNTLGHLIKTISQEVNNEKIRHD